MDKLDIDYIRRDLRKRGMVEDSFREELIDHICCEMQSYLQQGMPFKAAYEKVLDATVEHQLPVLQHQTLRSENYNMMILFRNHMKIVWRNILRNPKYTFINLSGLVLGFLCVSLIGLYIVHELEVDRAFVNGDRIYRITMSSTVSGVDNFIPTSYPTLGPALAGQYPSVEKFARVIDYKYSRQVPTLQVNDHVFYEDHVIFADSTFFSLFDFPFVEGDANTALQEPHAIVLTETMAKKYFGDKSALGQHVLFNANADLIVTGVVSTHDRPSHLRFEAVIPMSGLSFSGAYAGQHLLENWQMDWFWTYFQVSDSHHVADLEAGLNKLAAANIPDYVKENQARFYLQPLTDVHLHSHFDYNTDMSANGDIQTIYLFGSIALLVMAISGINFVNLMIASASRRYKEVGVSKVLGAARTYLRLQFLGESISIVLVSFLISMSLLPLILPLFNSVAGVDLQLQWLSQEGYFACLLGFALLLAFAAGTYPAFFLTRMDASAMMNRQRGNSAASGARFRRVLVGIQLTISIFLVVSTLVMFNQVNYMRNKSLGYDKDHIIMLRVRGTSIPATYESFKNDLLSFSGINSVTSVSEPIGREAQFMQFKLEGEPEDQLIKILNVGYDFVSTMGLQILEGRDFDVSRAADSIPFNSFIINEAFARTYGWDESMGKEIKNAYWAQAPYGKVVGVVKDFNFEPLQKEIEPILMFRGSPSWFVAVRCNHVPAGDVLEYMTNVWRKYEPSKPISYQFLDQSIQHVYQRDEKVADVFMIFSVLSIVTALGGLFGLVSFLVDQRLVEIGIRKILGATGSNIVFLILREYVLLVIASFMFALPLIISIMHQWLQQFAFRVDLEAPHFAWGFGVTALLVVATVFSKVFKASQTNPATVLKSQ